MSHPSIPDDAQTAQSWFQELLALNPLPEPGPAHYHARRELWLEPPPVPPTPPSPSIPRIKLENLLSDPTAAESEEVWKAGLVHVWQGLVGGSHLRKRLPLHIVLKILQAGWFRDGTWPVGAVAPDTDPEEINPDYDMSALPPPLMSSLNAQSIPPHEIDKVHNQASDDSESYSDDLNHQTFSRRR